VLPLSQDIIAKLAVSASTPREPNRILLMLPSSDGTKSRALKSTGL
jgi:hypothetical protein